LLARRRWDRLALVAGLAFSLAALHIVAGAAVIGPGTTRYGYVFLAPLAFAFGSLVGPWLTRAGEGRARPRLAPAWPLVAASALLLFDLGANVLEPRARQAGGSLAMPWTARGIAQRSYDAITADLDRSPGAGRRAVVSRSWWVGKPLEYLALGRRDVRVVALEDLGTDEAGRRARLGRLLAGGGYLIGFVDQSVADEARAATNGAALRLWAVEHSGVTFVTLARLARPGDAAAIARGAGSGDRLVR
jgi:hypothetical protein